MLFLAGAAVFLLVGGVLAQQYISMMQDQRRPSNVPLVNGNSLSVFGHELTPGSATSSGNQPTQTATKQPTKQPTAQPTKSGTVPNPPTGGATPVGSAFPNDATCNGQVARSSFEPRADNATANHTVPTAAQIAGLKAWNEDIGMDNRSDQLRKRITGNFTGTTDEILQWAACKWGIEPNIVRAEAVVESYWHESQRGDYTSAQEDCPPGTWDGKGCYQSYGILQIKYKYWKTYWPMSRDDTAFNADATLGWLRNCYEGWSNYLYDLTPVAGYPKYHAGDYWGCMGFWFSGSWYSQGAINYINEVKQAYSEKTWLQKGF
jgi:autotransporter family porin